MCAIAATQCHHNPFVPFIPPHVPKFQVLGVGLALGLGLRIIAMGALLGIGAGVALGVATGLKGREGGDVLLIPSNGYAALH